MSTLNFSIGGRSLTATKYAGNARQFQIVVDEPEALAGEDSAPNPVEYILAGYAGCLNVVTHVVAKELNIKINRLDINIDGDLNPSRFLGLSKDHRAGFQSLNVDIQIDSDSSPEEIARLLELIKDRCPVNDNLANPTPVLYNFKHIAGVVISN
jgi:uncharacterized OsmC-like protein